MYTQDKHNTRPIQTKLFLFEKRAALGGTGTNPWAALGGTRTNDTQVLLTSWLLDKCSPTELPRLNEHAMLGKKLATSVAPHCIVH